MNLEEHKRQLEPLLEDLADSLDVPPSKYEDAKTHYGAVGQWLNDADSALAKCDPDVMPQGSFALGTAIRPIGDDHYDVDALCLLKLPPAGLTQELLKEMVGRRLKEHKTYERLLKPKEGGRRCWTLEYADGSQFHLDVCPAIPDDYSWLISQGVPREYAKHAVCITDKTTWNQHGYWPRSNPIGYVGWFKDQMKVVLEEGRRIVANQKRAAVHDIEDYEVRTPLQRVIQILKRNRDVKYNGDADKPVSAIITTLAAQAYGNEPELVDAMLNVVPGMRRHIRYINGRWWVPNPVNPAENFADKWNEVPRKRELFFAWLDAVERQYQELLRWPGLEKVGEMLTESYGQRDTATALTKYASRTARPQRISTTSTIGLTVGGTRSLRFDVPHRERPRWHLVPRYRVGISARATRNGFRPVDFDSGQYRVPKHSSLNFEARTDAPRPYSVYWQVVNTGDEAARAGGLRGGIFPGNLTHTESTLYHGQHWIECFIVKGDQCVASSPLKNPPLALN